ncbi:hypothetical protein Godav_025986 [Gossypium davidsonii]|uniref:Aminotransferase-like plant mobile domain-containing protein n=2 Tax=Gossypium TaxID=3633 RepID=A0A7J8T9Y8_GOSDV|nr:hypothetical protein [Gossypium davidsonii]MBA0670757.1 hypothetical protein [Gossypium klotzschianum]
MQNSLQELKEIWDRWNDETKHLFYSNYGDLPYLFDVKVDEKLFRALAQYWNPTYSCLLLGMWIWCLQWRNIQLYYIVQGFRLIRHIPEPRMSQHFGRN